MNKHIRWIFTQYKAQKWFVLIMVFFTLASSAVQIAYPIAFKRMIDLLKDILAQTDLHPTPMVDHALPCNRCSTIFHWLLSLF